jgi:hypothetical protein
MENRPFMLKQLVVSRKPVRVKTKEKNLLQQAGG